MLHRVPECFGGLRGDHRLAAASHRRRNHHRQFLAVLIEHLADGDQRRLGIQRIEDRLDQQQIDAAGDQRAHLLHVGRLHLVESDHAETRIIGIGRVRKRHRQRPDRSRHKPLARGRVPDPIGPFPALPRRLLVDLPRQVAEKRIFNDLLIERGIFPPAMLPRIVHKEFALRDAGRAEGVGLDDVRPGLEKSAMDVADHLRLRQREQVAVVQQVLLRVLEALSADVRFRHAVGADGRAHRSVDDGDSALEDLLQRMLMGSRHVFFDDLRRISIRPSRWHTSANAHPYYSDWIIATDSWQL